LSINRFMSATALATSLLLTPAAWAQTGSTTGSTTATTADDQPQAQQIAPNSDPAQQEAQESGDVIVTGSRIARPNLDATAPITSIGIGELTNTGNVVIGDRLNELPALRSTFSQANSIRFIGTAGLNVLDLRGIGTARTLTVVNGRRHVTTSPGDSSVDVNTIPTDLIDRIDIVTGGNSAVYGSDAVAGVVNFVLKRDFDGIRLRGQGAITDEGDRGSYFVSATGGKNFADGRGNIAVALEYAQVNPLYFTDRESQYGAVRGRDQFNPTQNTLGESSLGDGIPDNTFLRNVSNIGISTGGAFVATCPTTAAVGESAAGLAARRALVCTGLRGTALPGVTGPELGRGFVFLPDGTLVANNGTADLRPFGSQNLINGLGSTLREVGQLNPGYKRYAANLLAHFDFSPAFKPFVEAKYVRIDAIQEGQATFNAGYSFNINNPFLTTQARNTLIAALAPGTTTFQTGRFNIDFAGRGENHRRETYRVVAGIGGDFNDDWKYEASFNYGRLETFYETRGNLVVARLNNSINAVRNAAGQIVCGINADVSTTNDDPACVPVNLFGNGAPSQAALNYFGYTSSRNEKAEQYVGNAFVAGDLSQLFTLPGGPVGFSIGGEYRRETSYSDFDDFTQTGATFLNAIATFDPPALKVKEAFGEIRIPLLANTKFFQELTIEAAGRVSDYNIDAVGTVYTYNVGGIWSPARGLRLRGSYAKSVRAPTQSDLFAAGSQTFVNAFVDPCGQQNINNNPNRAANCAAAGVPTTQTFNGITEPFTNRPNSGILALSGGNPLLEEERGTSYTFGGVFQPEFVPGLAITVDYYNITVKNAIQALAGQTIINQCYDNPSGIDNPFCAAVTRNPNGTFAGQDSVSLANGAVVTFPRTGSSVLIGPFNFAKIKTSGIDTDVSYRAKLSGDISLSLRGLVSYTIKKDNYTDILRPDFINQQLLEVGDPEWEGTLSANIDFGVLDFGYRFRYIGKQTIGTFEAMNSLQGRPPENPDQFPRTFYSPITYSDFRIGIDATDKFQFSFGVDNAFDRLPPGGLTGTGGGDGIFDNVGRRFYAGFDVRF